MASKIPSLSPALLLRLAERFGTPLFVTDAAVIRERSRQILSAFPGKKKILYAMKANSNPRLLQILRESGIHGIDAVSAPEVQLALDAGVLPEDIVFTGSNPSTAELRFVAENGVLINAGSLSEIRRFGEMFPGKSLALRINPGVGAGLHEKTITGGELSKFGIPRDQFSAALEILQHFSLSLSGIHAHVGSGFSTPEAFVQSAALVLDAARSFADLEFVDFGGGFGIPYREEQEHIDLPGFGRAIQGLLDDFSQKNARTIEMRLEPGRFLVAESTVLLSQVTTRKETSSRTFVGLDTGMHHLVRPAMYSAYHHIVNISHSTGPTERVDIVGNVCESGDIFGRDRVLEKTEEGDIVAILDAGAYGSAMSSNYNFHPFAAEVLVDGEKIFSLRKRQTYAQMRENFCNEEVVLEKTNAQ